MSAQTHDRTYDEHSLFCLRAGLFWLLVAIAFFAVPRLPALACSAQTIHDWTQRALFPLCVGGMMIVIAEWHAKHLRAWSGFTLMAITIVGSVVLWWTIS